MAPPAHGACSRFRNGSADPAVAPSPGGFLTDVDAMVALTKPQYSGPGSWARASDGSRPCLHALCSYMDYIYCAHNIIWTYSKRADGKVWGMACLI